MNAVPPPASTSPVAAVWLDQRDDVATLLRPMDAGAHLRVQCASERREVTLQEAIPLGHKVALRALAAGSRIRKYGEFIGTLTADVAEGGWIHTHNLATNARHAADQRSLHDEATRD
jgi:hypothetical protein